MKQTDTNVITDSRTQIICVDLDGTLVRTDTLIELIVAAVHLLSPLVLIRIIGWLLNGKARLKHELACRVELPIERLPFNEDVVTYLRKAHQQGHYIVLATAAPESVAKAVASHLGFFDQVLASNKHLNLRGAAKADRLVKEFGENGFIYAGNDHTDNAVWSRAAGAIIVGEPSRWVKVGVPVEKRFAPRYAPWRELVRALRPYQWVKNVLVFTPVIAAGAIFDTVVMLKAFAAFICFGAAASAAYICNDLFDLDSDRRHPRKRERPFASGRLPLSIGILAVPALLTLSLWGALQLSGAVALVLSGYILLTAAYSLRIKSLPLVDVFVLAILYVTRVLAGAAATGITSSIWLLSFICFLFLSLAFLKRHVEVAENGQTGSPSLVAGRGYYTQEEIPLTVMGISSGFAASLVLALYVESTTAAAVYSRPTAIWALVPLCLFWLNRMWLSGWRGYVDDDPIVYAAKDWVSRAVAVVGVACYLIAI